MSELKGRRMSDGALRDRIAAVIGEYLRWAGADPMDQYLSDLADALVLALGFRPEWGTKEPEDADPWLLGDSYEEMASRLRPGDRVMVRYVSDWKAVE